MSDTKNTDTVTVVSIPKLARRAVAAKLVADNIKDIEKQAKAELLEACQKTGARTLDVADDDGTPLATVSRAVGKVKAAVTDQDTFDAWLEKNYPEAVTETVVKQIDPDMVLRLLNAATKVGAAVDIATGEVMPGVEMKGGGTYITARPTAEAKARMKDLLADSPLLELAGGESGE